MVGRVNPETCPALGSATEMSSGFLWHGVDSALVASGKNICFLLFHVSLLCLKSPPCKSLSRAVSVTVFFTWEGWWWDELSECQGHPWGSMGFAFQNPSKHQCKNLPAGGKFKPFAPAAPSKAAEQSLLSFSGPGLLQGFGLAPVWQKMPLSPGDTEGTLPKDVVEWGVCTQDCRTGSRG